MKVYLINPPAASGVKVVREGRCMQRKGAWTAVWPPISLTQTAAMLENDGVEVKVSDCINEDMDFADLKNSIRAFMPDIVVINTGTPSIRSDLSVAAIAKKIDKKTKTAAFGIHVSALPEDCLKMEPALDFVVRGEPEVTICELAKAVMKDAGFGRVDGISFRKGKLIAHSRDRKPIEDLDALPYPAWHLIDYKAYKLPFTDTPFLMVDVGRGCPYNCVYCAAKTYYGRALHVPSPKRVADEMEWYMEEFGVNNFLFWSESFTIKHGYASDVCDEIIRRKIDVRWVCNSRVDSVDMKLLEKMKRAGCWMIGYGIESGSQDVLNRMRKGITLEQSRKAVKWSRKAGLEVVGHFVLGLPGETKETIKQTIRFAKGLGLDYAQFYCAVPFPGSELYEIAKKNGWINTDDWSMFEQNLSVMDMEGIGAREVMSMRNRALREFYANPRVIFASLKKIRSVRDVGMLVRSVREFLTWI